MLPRQTVRVFCVAIWLFLFVLSICSETLTFAPGSRMDRQIVPESVVYLKTSSKHRPVPNRLNDMKVCDGSPPDKVFQDEQRNVTLEGPDPAQSATLSPPYLGPSLVTVQLFKGVFFKPEDFEMEFTTQNQPLQVITQEQANGTSSLSLVNTGTVSTTSQSVTPLSIPSTSTYQQHDVISNYESQPPVNGPTNKRKICESENKVDHDDDSVQWLDDGQENEESSPSVKKSRFVTKQPDNGHSKVVRQSQRQPAKHEQQKELNKQNRQVITLALQCPERNCSQMFTTNQHKTAVDQLNHHLKVVHSIDLHRCMVLYCAESFPNSRALSQHIKHFHAGIVEWHCSICPKHFATSQILFKHKMGQHQVGQFECSYSACTFTAEYKAKVVSHYSNHHRVKPELVCQAKSGCAYRTTNPTLHKEHERAHLGIKPYRCEWRDCHYLCVSQSGTISHIKRVHFKSSKTSSSNLVALYGKPSDYISVDSSLL